MPSSAGVRPSSISDRRCFAGTIWTKQTETLTSKNFQIQTVDCRYIGKPLHQPLRTAKRLVGLSVRSDCAVDDVWVAIERAGRLQRGC